VKGMAAAFAKPACKNDDPRCSDWAATGECRANPSYMLTSCAKACRVGVEAQMNARTGSHS